MTTSSRGAERRSAILSATLRLLSELGYERLTIDAVVASAAASKTTVYRHWPDKRALVCAAVVAAAENHPRLPSTATNLRADLCALVALMARLGETESAHTFASLLAAAQKDAVIAETLRVTALEPRRRDCQDLVQRAIGRGELHDPNLSQPLFELVIGQIMVGFLLYDNGFDDASQTDFVDHTLIPMLTTRTIHKG